MVDWYLGTMGFSYKSWTGIFYPAGLSPRGYLAYYSRVFNAVEINTTFYGAPEAAQVLTWGRLVPDDFKFCVKTPRRITHELSLVNAVGEMRLFLETIRLLGPKLGPVLLQLPPSFSTAQQSNLVSFLETLPADLSFAVEFRHRSWYTVKTADLLQQVGVAWVAIDYLDFPAEVHSTADFLYVRWLGQHGRFRDKKQPFLEVEPQLRDWANRLQPHLDESKAVYGFFNDDYAGHSPLSCNQFKRIIGLPVVPDQPFQQRSLI